MRVCKYCLAHIELSDRADIEVWLDNEGEATCEERFTFHRPIGSTFEPVAIDPLTWREQLKRRGE